MLINIKYSSKSKSNNKVVLIDKINELESFQFTLDQINFFKNELKNNDTIYTNELGKICKIIKFKSLNSPKDLNDLRVKGHETFELLKNSCTDFQLESKHPLAIELFSEGFSLSSYSFDKYLSKDRKPKQRLQNVWTLNNKADLDAINAIVDATAWARDLVNEPLSYLTASQLALEIKEKCGNAGVDVKVFEKKKLESLKMGGILAVNKGSIDPPTFTILEWNPKNAQNKKPIVLVGKGIVYDTGGLSLKPTANSMDFMKSDMGGAAAIVGTVLAIAKLKTPIHVIALIPATDNRPGQNAYAPGDIVTMYDGTTVEVLNTDAEGRMVLADALAYANKYEPELVIDAATLTGAAARAIGSFGIVAMGNAKQKEFKLLDKAGFQTYDRIVQFPFWDDYFEEMKSPIADLNNLGSGAAGMITAGKFLEHFTKYPYIHLDIAGPAYTHKKNGYYGLGGTGAGVRLLTEYLKSKIN
jgi:leucyl aminopeptidase